MNICPISLRVPNSHGFATNICLIPLKVQNNAKFAKILFLNFLNVRVFFSMCVFGGIIGLVSIPITRKPDDRIG
jgi:hypothetical protein